MLSTAGMPTPYSVHVYEEVTSTQDVAREHAADGPSLAIAARQTLGRGRSGSAWESAPRAVAASLHLIPANWPHRRRTLIPLAAGIAVARLHALDLKWPNDLLLDGRKVGGILVEATGSSVTIGVGLNLWWPDPPSGRAGLWSEDPGPGAYSLVGSDLGAAVWTEVAKGPEDWSYDAYCASCVTLGHQITWDGGGPGVAIGVDRFDGSLLVDEGARRVSLRAGTVRHVRS
jgi:BirA family biotin operon repressor/biotin-[acetyl-CoA-carboxylase] ligase